MGPAELSHRSEPEHDPHRRVKSRPGRYAMYFHCQTTLVETFRRRYPGTFRYEGKRAIVFDANDRVPVGALQRCIALALTYHRPRSRRA